MKWYRSELHVHTVLSPCGDIEMIPPLIVESALEKGIDLLAVTDHNSCDNVQAVIEAAAGTQLAVFPGMELQTVEEVHVLCIFDRIDVSVTFQHQVYETLPAIENNPDLFGPQYIVDSTGDYLADNKRFLAGSSSLTLQDARSLVASLGGLFIPSHVNRNAFGLIQVLGMVPPDLKPDALEVSYPADPVVYAQNKLITGSAPVIQNGDVHFLGDFIGKTSYNLEYPTVAEIKLALKNQKGRSFRFES